MDEDYVDAAARLLRRFARPVRPGTDPATAEEAKQQCVVIVSPQNCTIVIGPQRPADDAPAP